MKWMMKTCHPKNLVLSLLSALLLISCGDGGFGNIAAGVGIGGSGTIGVGTITAFKGIVFDDIAEDAEAVYEGGTPDDFALGVNLEVKGAPVDIIRSIFVADKVSLEED